MNLRTAVLLVVGLMMAAVLHGGIYTIVATRSGDGAIAYRLNRLTGSTACITQDDYEKIRPCASHKVTPVD